MVEMGVMYKNLGNIDKIMVLFMIHDFLIVLGMDMFNLE